MGYGKNMKKIGLFFILIFFYASTVLGAGDYAKVDSYAKRAPVLKNSSNLNHLVQYLVRPYETDKEKARVLLAWIVYNIDYDGYKLNAIEDKLKNTRKHNRQLFIPDNDILETRLGVCGDIAKLYQRMGEMAKLEVALIYGRVKHEDESAEAFELGPGHVWTAVKIDGQWEYVDPTFAMHGVGASVLGDVERKREYQRIVKKRSKRSSSVKKARDGREVDDRWFLPDKDEMIKTHFPDDEKWQLQAQKLTKQEFLGLSDREYKNMVKKDKKKRKKEVVR